MNSSRPVGILGAGGFVGKGVAAAFQRAGHPVLSLPRLVLPAKLNPSTPDLGSPRFRDELLPANLHLIEQLASVDVAINAAGMADPASADVATLWAMNKALPAAFDVLASEAGLRRVVHISSAAVQGGNALNEKPEWSPVTAYGRSKAEAEQYLLKNAETPTIIYRATSVMGPGRPIVDKLINFYAGRLAPVFGDGSAPLPLSALPNTGDAVATLALAVDAPLIALQPFEGVTQLGLAEALAQPHTRVQRILLPPGVSRICAGSSKLPSSLMASLRRADLLIFGQSQAATALADCGFTALTPALGYLRSLRSPLIERS